MKALLETNELIFRGGLRRRVPFDAIADLRTEGDELRFRVGGEQIALRLGAATARRWATAIAVRPTLAQKLGIDGTRRAWVLGSADDGELAAALVGATASRRRDAVLVIAVVDEEPDLVAAIAEQQRLGVPELWIIHGKGRAAAIGGTAVRDFMRAHAYIDVKVAAVSAERSATKYRPAR